MSSLRKKVSKTVQPLALLYQAKIQHLSRRQDKNEIAAKLPTLPLIKSSLYQERRKRLLPMTHTKEEVESEREWKQTFSGERFLLWRKRQIIIFFTTENLNSLASADDVFMDGTFHTCPQLFYQIFTIHPTRYGYYFPLVYCLLLSKSREIYGRVITLLKTKSEELGIELKPKTILSDFELSIIQVAQLAFPMAVLKGCYFHFCQCLIRKVQYLGLQRNYRENPKLKSFICKTTVLAFVPQQYICLAWQALKAEAPQNIVRQFVGSYPPSFQNDFETESARTSYYIEGWHTKLTNVVGKAHPNVYEIVELFK